MLKRANIWIAVKLEACIMNWWPQINGNGSISPIGGTFKFNAFLGGNKNDILETGIHYCSIFQVFGLIASD